MILETCLLIILKIICCLFIDMVENAGDDPGDRKPSVVDSTKVEASVKVEASNVNYDVCKLRQRSGHDSFFSDPRYMER